MFKSKMNKGIPYCSMYELPDQFTRINKIINDFILCFKIYCSFILWIAKLIKITSVQAKISHSSN